MACKIVNPNARIVGRFYVRHSWDIAKDGRRECRRCSSRITPDRTERQRFDDKVYRVHWGCWLWKGSLDKDGYGKFGFSGRRWEFAYRTAWRLFGGTLPTWPMQIDHRCKVRRCVNYKHLEIVTYQENQRRKRKAVCKRGHKMKGANLYHFKAYGKPSIRCKACIPIQNRRLAK